MSTTTAEQTLVSNEWLDYFYQQHMMDDLDVPFGALSDAVSDDTSFGDDVIIPSSDTNLQVSCTDETETVFVPNVTETFPNTAAPATTVTTVASSPENSSNTDFSPKATIAKQVRRRSRASRRTPTTLLNASIKNFRTLVQQYTGCHSATSGFNRRGKGPITLNFGVTNEQNDFPVSLATSFGGGYYYPEQPQFQVNEQHADQIYGGNQRLHSSYGEY